MNFIYDAYFWSKDYIYDGRVFRMDPTQPVPVPDDHEESGKTLAEVWGMSDADAQNFVLEEKWSQVRKHRDAELARTDWTQGADVPDAIKTPHATYRQALRDITTTYSSPDDVVWPEKP